ncbi:MAG: hypothetical protein K2X90_01045 [Candidatus Babeliaceae bacterium]|nr:hypothetical protein [Candidatus Babeliaceae bacterium]
MKNRTKQLIFSLITCLTVGNVIYTAPSDNQEFMEQIKNKVYPSHTGPKPTGSTDQLARGIRDTAIGAAFLGLAGALAVKAPHRIFNSMSFRNSALSNTAKIGALYVSLSAAVPAAILGGTGLEVGMAGIGNSCISSVSYVINSIKDLEKRYRK